MRPIINISKVLVFLFLISCAGKSKLPTGFPDPGAWTAIDSEIMAADIVQKLTDNEDFKALKEQQTGSLVIYVQSFANNSKVEFDEKELAENIVQAFENLDIKSQIINDVSESAAEGLLIRGSVNNRKAGQKEEKSTVYKAQCSMIKLQTGAMVNTATVEIKKYLN